MDFEQRLEDLYGDYVPFYDYTDFLGVTKYMSAKCKNCHRLIESDARKFIRQDKPFKCGYCSGMITNTSIVTEEIFNLVGDDYELLSDYTGAHKPLTLKHNICGNSFKSSKNLFVTKNQRCTFCSASNGEQLIQNYLNKNNLHYFFDRKYLGDLVCVNEKGNSVRFDFQILNDKGNICAIIEFDGRQHYQEVDFFKSTKANLLILQSSDNIKNIFCEVNNIPLLRLPIHELIPNKTTGLTSNNISIKILYSKLELFLKSLNQNLELDSELLETIFTETKNKVINETLNIELKQLLEDTTLIWKDVPEYIGLYKISNNGNVIKFNYKLEPILELTPQLSGKNPNSSLVLRLSDNRRIKNFIVAKLVYALFSNIPYEDTRKLRILYLDGNKLNLSFENIRLLTHKEAQSKLHTKVKRTACRIDIHTNERKVYYPISSVIDDGFDTSAVVKCCKGKSTTHKGYHWKYLEN